MIQSTAVHLVALPTLTRRHRLMAHFVRKIACMAGFTGVGDFFTRLHFLRRVVTELTLPANKRRVQGCKWRGSQCRLNGPVGGDDVGLNRIRLGIRSRNLKEKVFHPLARCGRTAYENHPARESHRSHHSYRDSRFHTTHQVSQNSNCLYHTSTQTKCKNKLKNIPDKQFTARNGYARIP